MSEQSITKSEVMIESLQVLVRCLRFRLGRTYLLTVGPPRHSQQAACSSFLAHQRRQELQILPTVLRVEQLDNG
jgi:hypothetical protein